MNNTDMLKVIEKRSLEFFNASKYSNDEYDYTTFDEESGIVHIHYWYSCYGQTDNDYFEVTFEEYNSSKGVQMFLERTNNGNNC